MTTPLPRLSFIRDIDQREAARRDERENAARLATVHLTRVTNGSGQLIEEEPLLFGATFLQAPALATGLELVKPADTARWQFPQVTAGVWEWVTDRRGFYIGAQMFFIVTVAQVDSTAILDTAPAPVLRHHLQFSAVALKQLPGQAMSELAALEEPHRPYGST